MAQTYLINRWVLIKLLMKVKQKHEFQNCFHLLSKKLDNFHKWQEKVILKSKLIEFRNNWTNRQILKLGNEYYRVAKPFYKC